MKDYLIITILLTCGVMAIIRKPLYGLYGWFLVSFLNIHRLGWGLASAMQPGLVIAGCTLLGVILHPKGRLRFTVESKLVLLFWFFTLITTSFALNSDLAWRQWIEFSKIILFFFITIYLIDNYKDLKNLIIVATLCIAFYGVKGGIFSLITGGQYRIYGPADSFIADNNELGLALNMTLPMLWWLANQSSSTWIRRLWYSTIFLNIIGIIFTYSRGAFLTLILVGLMILKNSKKKVLTIAIISIVLIVGSVYVGEKWIGRMETLKNYQEESSAMSRIVAWGVALDFALDHPLLGGGFDAMNADVYQAYGVDIDIVSHSIYFGTLAEQGFVGLFIYLSIFFVTLLSIIKYRNYTHSEKMSDLFLMIKITLIAFLFNGAFFERQYFDYAFHFIAIVSIMKLLISQEQVANSDKKVMIQSIALNHVKA